MVYRGEYDPYGNLVYEWGSAGLNTRKFTGYERDGNTGLDYANARMYGPGRGRFLQPDPIGIGGANTANPQILNRYSYVQNDPVNFVDKSGKLLGAPDGPSAGGSECRSTFIAVDWTSDTVGTGFISYGFTHRFCIYSSGGGENTGMESLVTVDDLVEALKNLPKGCVDFFGGQSTINSRINELQNGSFNITFIDMRSPGGQLIPTDEYHRTYQQYWDQTGTPDAVAMAIYMHGADIDRTILIGSDYHSWWKYNWFNKSMAAGYISQQEYQQVTLVHEYMHILNNMNHKQLVEKWEKEGAHFNGYWRDKGLGAAIQDWIRGGCKKKS